MTASIIFEAHSTSVDNETGTASGHRDAPLSDLGREQALELGQRYRARPPAEIYCSDLRRSWETAEIAFVPDGPPIKRDPRLRECDYGDFTGSPSSVIAGEASQRLATPFPGGESYEDACARIRGFLCDLASLPVSGELIVIGHRATQYAFELWLNGIALAEAVSAPWSWQPGWSYELNSAAMGRLGVKADART